jgi:hypothetical protein
LLGAAGRYSGFGRFVNYFFAGCRFTRAGLVVRDQHARIYTNDDIILFIIVNNFFMGPSGRTRSGWWRKQKESDLGRGVEVWSAIQSGTFGIAECSAR